MIEIRRLVLDENPDMSRIQFRYLGEPCEKSGNITRDWSDWLDVPSYLVSRPEYIGSQEYP